MSTFPALLGSSNFLRSCFSKPPQSALATLLAPFIPSFSSWTVRRQDSGGDFGRLPLPSPYWFLRAPWMVRCMHTTRQASTLQQTYFSMTRSMAEPSTQSSKVDVVTCISQDEAETSQVESRGHYKCLKSHER